MAPVTSSGAEADRFEAGLEPVIAWIESAWICLFEARDQAGAEFVFPDGFALLFYLRVLYANEILLLRGHWDDSWTLTTTLQRLEAISSARVAAADNRALQFISEIGSVPIIGEWYHGELPYGHRQAVLQHYGFPTDLLDFTYSYDVALFFAEGASDYLPDRPTPIHGAIYAVPTYALPKTARLVTLPPQIMRPSLQRGVFVERLSDTDRTRIEQEHKFCYHHTDMPIWNGLGDIHFGSATGMPRYLLPASDPLETIAEPLRDW